MPRWFLVKQASFMSKEPAQTGHHTLNAKCWAESWGNRDPQKHGFSVENRPANEPSPAMPSMSWTSTEYWWKYNALETLSRQVRGPLWVKVTQSCPTLYDPMDCTLHGILQVRMLEWVAFPFSRVSFRPRDRTQVSLIAGGFFTSWATREAQEYWNG